MSCTNTNPCLCCICSGIKRLSVQQSSDTTQILNAISNLPIESCCDDIQEIKNTTNKILEIVNTIPAFIQYQTTFNTTLLSELESIKDLIKKCCKCKKCENFKDKKELNQIPTTKTKN